jgi:hypothetical protein
VKLGAETMTVRRISVFFYGLFMDEELLRQKGIEPAGARQACVRGFALRIGQRATLVPESDGRVYGMLMELSQADIECLYSEPSVSMYRPEAVVAEVEDRVQVPAVCFNLQAAPAPGETNQAYAQKLRDLARRLRLPADYIDRIG